MRRAIAAIVALSAAPVGGCGEQPAESSRVLGDTLTVYASLPAHGPSRAAGDAVALGMRRALAEAGGRAGGKSIELVRLASTRPGDVTWDPGTVEANAKSAVDDERAVAYVGELDDGASAVSLPVTNRSGILQVSPADGLTSLTRTPPGRPRAGPERYYPAHVRTFARLVPPDLDVARRIVRSLRERGSQRLAIVHGRAIADRELESMAIALIGDGSPREIGRVTVDGDDPESVADVVDSTAAIRPDAILFAAGAGREARAVLAALDARLPGVPVVGGPSLARARGAAPGPDRGCALTGVPRGGDLPPSGRRLLAELRREGGRGVGGEALLGYDAMRLVLAAIDAGGPDRRLVARAPRAAADHDGVAGRYEIDRRGDIVGRSVACAV